MRHRTDTDRGSAGYAEHQILVDAIRIAGHIHLQVRPDLVIDPSHDVHSQFCPDSGRPQPFLLVFESEVRMDLLLSRPAFKEETKDRRPTAQLNRHMDCEV